MNGSFCLRRRPRRHTFLSLLLMVGTLIASVAGATAVGGRPAGAAVSRITGPDVSNWNHKGPIDMGQVKASGQAFVIVKASEGAGSTAYVNPYFKGDFANAAAVGLYRGAYDFATPRLPVTSAMDQANLFADTVGSLHGAMDLPPVVDLEQSGGLNATDLAIWLQVWLNTAHARFGRVPMIYSGPGFWASAMASTTQFSSYPLWEAEWTTAAAPDPMGGWKKATFWQYSDHAAIPGITGAVDHNRFQGSAADLVALAAERPTTSPYPDGTFIVSRETGAVYRTAGGAPIYVSTWAAFPPGQSLRAVDQAVIDSLPPVPADGTVIVGAQRGEWYVVAGGAPLYTSTFAAIPAGTVPVVVDQNAIDHAGQSGTWNHLRSLPLDGTYLVGAQSGAWFVVAGGAPLYTSTFAAMPSGSHGVGVDQNAIDLAGAGGVWNHLRALPTDGTVLLGTSKGEVYIVAGGAPIYTSTYDVVADSARIVWTDQIAIDNAGAGGLWNHLRAQPADGTVLVAQPRGAVYIVAGGAPIYTGTTQPIVPGKPWVTVDEASIDSAGTTRYWGHLRAQPVDGTVLIGAQRGEWYIVAGGAPIYTSTFAPIAAGRTPVVVDQGAIDGAGAGLVAGHLDAVPANGTVLIGAQRGEWYIVVGGAPIYISTFAPVPPGSRAVVIDVVAMDAAGSGSPWNHLRLRPAAGTLFRAVQTQKVFQVNSLGQAKPYAGVVGGALTAEDQAAVDNAGGARPWNHLAH